ncbi:MULTISPECIES: ATP-binding protein [Streptomyces]|uniref:ATP-binding protein n=1 Tax=Streptomyces TaxID=1883 RepID=UPI002691D925
MAGRRPGSGPGLTPEQAARVFERFYRVDASRSRQEGGGAGLGLAIASALVSAHHGEVELVTSPGEGAVFRVLLPSAAEL